MPAYDDPAVVRRAQRLEIARSVPMGLLAPMEATILLTIAIKHFDASWWVKWLVAGAGGIGLVVAPWATSVARKWGRPAMLPTALVSVVIGLGLFVAATGTITAFVLGTIAATVALNLVFPLITTTYSQVFPPAEVGRRVGWGMSTKVLFSGVFGIAVGEFLTDRIDLWWVVVVAAGVLALVMAAVELRMPSEPIPLVAGGRTSGRPHFHLMAEDRRLRLTISAWMLMGFGNLMLLPLRVEYLAQPRYGIDASPAKILVLTAVVPAAVRLLTMPVFGQLFDRINFFAGRILVNVLFALYIGAFFTGTNDIGLTVGAVLFGVASAGGDIMWTLWVVKFAPPDRTADYMGLHTFFTGVRVFFAPLLAFAIVGHVSLVWIAVISSLLIVAASVLLVPDYRLERASRAAAP
ncbi:MAG: MFS transporter [Ilumatobacteraceae bacterium]